MKNEEVWRMHGENAAQTSGVFVNQVVFENGESPRPPPTEGSHSRTPPAKH